MGEITFMNYNYSYNCITFTIALQLQVHEQYNLSGPSQPTLPSGPIMDGVKLCL